MTNDIKYFYWEHNCQNCINILNYEFQGVCVVDDDSYGNDESPSCRFDIDRVIYKLFFPSDYKGQYSEFVLLDETDYDADFEVKLLGVFPTIEEVINYFKEINKI
jgi:hypothetical protein